MFRFFEIDSNNPIEIELDQRVEELYHYTSKESSNGIKDNNCFWVTRSDNLNDPSEILYFKDIIERTITKLKMEWVNLEGLYETDGKLYNEILNYLQYFKDNYREILEKRNYDFFILSLSNNGESEYMWRNYSKSNGSILEIDPVKILKNPFKINKLTSDFEFFTYAKVVYNLEKQVQVFFDDILDLYIRSIKIAAKKRLTSLGIDFFNEMQTIIVLKIHTYSQFFKDKKYQNEEEYRLAFVIGKESDDKKIKYRKDNTGRTIPYIIFEIEKDVIVDIRNKLKR